VPRECSLFICGSAAFPSAVFSDTSSLYSQVYPRKLTQRRCFAEINAFKSFMLKLRIGGPTYMPSHKVHAYVDRMLFGRVYWKVHRQIDSAYPYLGGRHRIFWHDPISAMAIAAEAYPGNPNAVSAAICHIQLDNMCSADPVFEKQLEALAIVDAKKRRSSRRRRKELIRGFPELKDFIEDCRKWVELRNLSRRLSE
jgi:hypothetical protein